ncbi:hypothetical protein D9M69_684260 [compost metagenome]
MVGQGHVAALLQYRRQQRFDELHQVVDLLELAPRVLVELALAREDVQLLQQLDRLAFAQFGQLFLQGFLRRLVCLGGFHERTC